MLIFKRIYSLFLAVCAIAFLLLDIFFLAATEIVVKMRGYSFRTNNDHRLLIFSRRRGCQVLVKATP